MQRIALILFFLVLGVGCATVGIKALDRLYGSEDPSRYDQVHAAVPGAPDFTRDVKPILDQRCVVCHACYDAPCQLQLGSYEGITRGANPEKVYNSARLVEAPTTRLFFDADSTQGWRSKGFFPVLNERKPDPEVNIKASVLAQLLDLKAENPGPTSGVLLEDHYDFSLDRPQVCTSLQGIDDFRTKHPEWGMPFGLPALNTQEKKTLERWLEAGAPRSTDIPLRASDASSIERWEAFFNGDDLKTRLMARFLYEHWFLAHIYFDDHPTGRFFEMVRSRTPSGQPISLIATRRPYDDPGVDRVYYRLRPLQGTVVSKTHMPYPLNPQKMHRIKGWFLDASYKVDQLPTYDPKASANPFITFKAIPVHARYRLMLEEAQFTVMGFIKGPSCRGQTALNVIDDYFWIGFVNPDMPEIEASSEFLTEALTQISLPTQDQSTSLLTRWSVYADQQDTYLRRKAAWVDHFFKGRVRVTADVIWDGDGNNPNAGLTVFRHFDSASVEKGLLGRTPQKGLFVGYEALERIHYLLVAGFDVYGNLGHQLEARLYMDFLRMEGEHNFLMALPKNQRMAVRDQWYRGVGEDVKRFVMGEDNVYDQETGIPFVTQDPLQELYDLWKARLAPVQPHRYDVNSKTVGAAMSSALEPLSSMTGSALQYLPENSFLMISGKRGARSHFTLLRNSAHSNIAHLFDEENRRLPKEDTLTLSKGFIGAYPNVFFIVDEADVKDFVRRVGSLQSEQDYQALASRYAVRRTDPRFWTQSDLIQADTKKMTPIEAGIFDLNRYENR